MAASPAVVTVGYNIIIGRTDTGEPIRLLNESILNGTVLMILVTCTIASFVTQKSAQNIALDKSEEETDNADIDERVLIPVKNESTIEELINLSVTIKSKKNKKGLYAITIIDNKEEGGESEKESRSILNKAAIAAAATDNFIHQPRLKVSCISLLFLFK